VGGVASGKSSVADALRRRGAVVLDADAAGHAALLEPAVKEALRARWGKHVFDANGDVNRGAVAKIVFAANPQAAGELLFLESVTHPVISATLLAEIESLRRRGDVPIAVLDAAVMLKAGWDKFCDRLVFVDVPRDVRWSRAQKRGWTEAQFDAREAAQTSVEEKRARADYVLDNSGSVGELETQVDRLWKAI
jgi:dephospho-CoA kinase